jgi:hypothetical protein
VIWLWFLVIQLVSLTLAIVGIPICAALSLLHAWRVEKSPVTGKLIDVWPKAFWLWSNSEDGVLPHWYWIAHPEWSTERVAFTWTAWRNSVGNLRFVPGVSGKGRPLVTWKMFGQPWHAGWSSDGWPTFSRAL